MLTEPLRRLLQGSLDRIALLLHRMGISPNALTFVGALLHLGVLYLLARGDYLSGALLLLFASGLDGIDGTLARRTGQASRVGAFLDSSLDRIAEILVYLGLLLDAQRRILAGEPALAEPWLIYMALSGSLMVSYTRARSEGIGLPARSGAFTRLERMAVLWIGLMAGWLAPALWIVMLGAWFTTFQRVAEVWRLARESDAPGAGRRDPVEAAQADAEQGVKAPAAETLERGSRA